VWAASDLTAETFAQAWLGRDRFRDEHGGSAFPWLLELVRNVLRETVRHDRVETRARERLGLPVDLAAEEGYAMVDERLSSRLALAAALDDLPEHEREALELRVVGELQYDEVAEQLAIRPRRRDSASRARCGAWRSSPRPGTRKRGRVGQPDVALPAADRGQLRAHRHPGTTSGRKPGRRDGKGLFDDTEQLSQNVSAIQRAEGRHRKGLRDDSSALGRARLRSAWTRLAQAGFPAMIGNTAYFDYEFS
jgi:RNA polymerase sigma factor (sigma-70 family)